MEEEKDKKGFTGRDFGSKTIPILGELESRTKEGITAAAGTIYDYAKEKFQQTINEEYGQQIESLNNSFNEVVQNDIIPRLNEAEEKVDNNIPYTIVYENQYVNIPCDAYGNCLDDSNNIETKVKLYHGNIVENLAETNGIIVDSQGSEYQYILDEQSGDNSFASLSILGTNVKFLQDLTEVDFHLVGKSETIVYGKIFFNKVKQGKSAFEEWKDEDPVNRANATPAMFILDLKNVDGVYGPKYAYDETAAISDADGSTVVYFIPNAEDSTKYDIVLVEGGEAKPLATEISGDITNYAGIYDVSEDNKTGNTPKPYSDLSEAITDIVTKGVAKVGMTIKYKSTDGKYYQYRYTLADLSGFSNENNWEVVGTGEIEGEVDKIKDAIGTIEDVERPIEMTWKQGTIQDANGKQTYNTTKGIFTDSFILIEDNDIKISVEDGYFIKIVYYYTSTELVPDLELGGEFAPGYVGVVYKGNANGSWDFTKKEAIVNHNDYFGKYIKVLIGNVSNTEVTTAESSNVTISKLFYGIGGKTFVDKLNELDDDIHNPIKVHPHLEYGRLTPAYGGLTEWSLEQTGIVKTTEASSFTNYFENSIRTARFIDVSMNNAISVKTSIDCYMKVVYYDEDYARIGHSGSDFIEMSASTLATISIIEDAKYIKIFFQKESVIDDTPIEMFTLTLNGVFAVNYEKKGIRNVDDGYQHLAVKVARINPSSVNDDTDEVQDETEYGVDHGVLALPESYTNEGKPTRLIIYCHGAAVNYYSSTGDGVVYQTRFNNGDLLPEYWLSEGYAIMDMDGELESNDNQQHTYVPEAIECYVAAYKWVVDNYNIYDDGVLLGGRSQGGGMCFAIMQSQIPVIAACPLVPVCNWLWWWSYMPRSTYRAYFADKAGFIGTNIWTGSSDLTRVLKQDDITYLRSNFDALRRYSPFWRMIVDLPTNANILVPDDYIEVESTALDEPTNYKVLLESLHAKAPCPIKFFDNAEDTTVPYKRNALLMYRMLINGGQDTEFRMYDTTNDVDTSKSAHHFELRSDRCISYINSRGVELQNVPIVYIEMLAFWQRYEY